MLKPTCLPALQISVAARAVGCDGAVMAVLNAPQVILKSNQRPPYSKNSFTFKIVMVSTARTHLGLKWLQEKSMTSAVGFEILRLLPRTSMPDAHLLDADSLVEFFLSELAAKRVGKEFIGKKGVPGYGWPDLSEHDANHDFLRGKPVPARNARA